MSEWRIQPFDSFGPLRFGTKRDVVRKQLGQGFTSFKKGPDAVNETDAYDKLGKHLYYGEDDRLNWVEAFPVKEVSVLLESVDFFKLTLDDLIEKMAKGGHLAVRDVDGCYFEAMGIAIYSPGGRRVEGVSASERKKFAAWLELKRQIAQRRAGRAVNRADVRNPFK